jgi:hypothetical protein
MNSMIDFLEDLIFIFIFVEMLTTLANNQNFLNMLQLKYGISNF